MEIGRYVRNAGIWGSRKNLTARTLGILLLAAAYLGRLREFPRICFVGLLKKHCRQIRESSQAGSPETGKEPGTTEASETEPSEEMIQESEKSSTKKRQIYRLLPGLRNSTDPSNP